MRLNGIGRPRRPIKAVHQGAANLVLLGHYRDRLRLVDRRFALAPTLGVGLNGLLGLIRETQLVHYQSARFVSEHAVHTGNGLHEIMHAHRLT